MKAKLINFSRIPVFTIETRESTLCTSPGLETEWFFVDRICWGDYIRQKSGKWENVSIIGMAADMLPLHSAYRLKTCLRRQRDIFDRS